MIWRTPAGRSKVYVETVAKELSSLIVTGNGAVRLRREQGKAIVCDSLGQEESFDEVVFACHPDQALDILGNSVTIEEKEYLSHFQYSVNDTYVHSDESLMPQSRAAWASWNYIGTSSSFEGGSLDRPVFVTYWLNRLQNLTHPRPILVSLNPHTLPAPEKTYHKIQYAHPQYTAQSVSSQRQVQAIQGRNHTWFCGAWLGYGFHEDGVKSGLQVAARIADQCLPWEGRPKDMQTVRRLAPSTTSDNHKIGWLQRFVGLFTHPLIDGMVWLCRAQIISFLRKGFKVGRLDIKLLSGETLHFGDDSSNVSNREKPITVVVTNDWFWIRVALEYDLGLGRSYMAGEWHLEGTEAGTGDDPHCEALTAFLALFVRNMSPAGTPQTNGKKSTGLSVSKLATAWVGGAVNWLWYRLTMDNTIANSRSNIHAVRSVC